MSCDYKFMENKNCEFYPCHGKTPINCLFCYCPLYFLPECPGTPGQKDGIKDCSNCEWVHDPENFLEIMDWLSMAIYGKEPEQDDGEITDFFSLAFNLGNLFNCKIKKCNGYYQLVHGDYEYRIHFFSGDDRIHRFSIEKLVNGDPDDYIEGDFRVNTVTIQKVKDSVCLLLKNASFKCSILVLD